MFNAIEIRERIVQSAITEAELPAPVADDVAFHMTDWLDDLAALVEFFKEPKSYDAAKVNALLLKFLVHVPNHVAAAAKLYAEFPVTDVFGVGAIDPQSNADA
jgi:hypothetical protein